MKNAPANVSVVACPTAWCVAVRNAVVQEFARHDRKVEGRLWKGEPLPDTPFIVIGNRSFVRAVAERAPVLLATAPAGGAEKGEEGTVSTIPVFRFSSGVPVADWQHECVDEKWLARHDVFSARSGDVPGFTVA